MLRFGKILKSATAFSLAFVFLASATAQTPMPPPPELKFAEIQAKEKFLGDRWSYMKAGPLNAPVIVTLHGLGDNSMAWRFQLKGLSDRYRVIAWNAPGYMLTDGFKIEAPGCREFVRQPCFAMLCDVLSCPR